MAKNTLSLEVEKIAKKVANEVLKNHPLMISMAQWHSAFTAENKNIRDANRILELRIIQLEKEIEFLKKQTVSGVADGEFQPPPEEPTQPDIPQEPAMLPRELKKSEADTISISRKWRNSLESAVTVTTNGNAEKWKSRLTLLKTSELLRRCHWVNCGSFCIPRVFFSQTAM